MSTEVTPIISTIIPTFRRPELLRRAIRSVLAQSGPPLQVCVYDNASGDGTANVVADLAATDSRVRYYCHASNIGSFDNFQFGMSHINTPFFSMLSDDDVLLPGFFERAMCGFDAFPQAAFWAGLTVRMAADGRIYDAKAEQWSREGLFAPPEGMLQLAQGKALTWNGIVFRKRVVDETGLLDPIVKGSADLDFMLRIAARGSFVLSKQPVAVFLINPESFSETGPFSAFWPGWLKMIRNLAEIESLSSQSRTLAEQLLNDGARRMLFRRAASALAKRDYSFVLQAAQALDEHYGQFLRSISLRALASLCSNVAPAQSLYTGAYRAAVNHLLMRRSDLQNRHGNLARHL